MNQPISRRTALKGLGTTIALPWLESMSAAAPTASTVVANSKHPLRTGFVYIPNGVHIPDWTPSESGPNFQLPWILQPLKDLQPHFNVLTGLTLDKARANGDGGGDHARAMAAFLTGRQPRKTDGAEIRAGISFDQLIAERIGSNTRFASLELGCEGGRLAGSCDSGYSCAYSSTISWRGESTPNAKEVDPKLVFERLFGNGSKPEEAASRAKRDRYNSSILDMVREDAKSLQSKLGSTDRRKVDEYMTAVRELEVRIQKSAEWAKKVQSKPDFSRPAGIPKDYAEHIRLMYDLLIVALQTDTTRVFTFPHANEGSNRPYPFLSVPEGHHDLSHHGNDKKKQEKIRIINRFHVEQLAYFLKKLQSIREGEGTLLDHCQIVFGSGNSDGNRHNHDDLPILLIGGANGTIKTGRHLKFKRETPLMNLYLSMAERLGIKLNSFGDSTGKLTGLES